MYCLTSLPSRCQRECGGFTLIELLVSVTIMLLLVGGSMAAFIRYNDRQALVGAVRELQGYLRSAQVKAQAGDKPDDCDRLLGYVVTASQQSPVTVMLTANCDNEDFIRQTATLPEGVSLSAPLTLEAAVLQGGFSAGTTITLTSTAGQEYSFSVTRGGELSEGTFSE
jgi:prepilin-type N-terminal cleavage/methylation domain-containing protein